MLGLLWLVTVWSCCPHRHCRQQVSPPSTRSLKLGESFVTRFWTHSAGRCDVAIGLAIAMVAGIALGVVIGSVPMLRKATNSTIEFLRPIPSVALIPLAVLLYGTDMRATLLLVVYASFWQVLVQVLYGVQDVDPVARETSRSYRFRATPSVPSSGRRRCRTCHWLSSRRRRRPALLEVTGELIIGVRVWHLIAVAASSGADASMYHSSWSPVSSASPSMSIARRSSGGAAWHPSIRRGGQVTSLGRVRNGFSLLRRCPRLFAIWWQ